MEVQISSFFSSNFSIQARCVRVCVCIAKPRAFRFCPLYIFNWEWSSLLVVHFSFFFFHLLQFHFRTGIKWLKNLKLFPSFFGLAPYRVPCNFKKNWCVYNGMWQKVIKLLIDSWKFRFILKYCMRKLPFWPFLSSPDNKSPCHPNHNLLIEKFWTPLFIRLNKWATVLVYILILAKRPEVSYVIFGSLECLFLLIYWTFYAHIN